MNVKPSLTVLNRFSVSLTRLHDAVKRVTSNDLLFPRLTWPSRTGSSM